MKKISFLLGLTLISSTAFALDYKELCKMRSDLMKSIAFERDSGKPKKQVKDHLKKTFGKKLPSAADSYVDSVYEYPNIKPNQIAQAVLVTCYEEFGVK